MGRLGRMGSEKMKGRGIRAIAGARSWRVPYRLPARTRAVLLQLASNMIFESEQLRETSERVLKEGQALQKLLTKPHKPKAKSGCEKAS
jgi:hypothetical protein